jgi:DNA-binding winged helix-turn-helix (wHTH) protein
VHVSRLRRKLGPVYSRCVITEYRVGYQFRPPIVTKGLSASKQEYPVWQTGYTSKACSGVGETPNRR